MHTHGVRSLFDWAVSVCAVWTVVVVASCVAERRRRRRRQLSTTTTTTTDLAQIRWARRAHTNTHTGTGKHTRVPNAEQQKTR